MAIPKERDTQLRQVARDAAEQLLFRSKARIIGSGIEVYDIMGPLLFVDYVVEPDPFSIGWVRTIPDGFGTAMGPLVSAELGPHPAARKGGVDGVLSKHARASRTVSNRARMAAVDSLLKVFDEAPQYAEVLTTEPRVVCYHYPEIGVEVENASGNLVYIDVEDGETFVARESGAVQSETRRPYSFILTQQEMGHPGSFTIPQDSFELPGMTLIGQKRDNWCAAASCQMVLKFHGVETEQSEIARLMRIPNNPQHGGAPDLGIQTEAYGRASEGQLSGSHDLDPLGEECINELWTNRRPLKNAIALHAQVIAGWNNSQYGPQYLIYDPLPVGSGSKKYQNPAVVYSRNFVYASPSKSGGTIASNETPQTSVSGTWTFPP